MKPKIVNQGSVFGDDNWYMFYCGKCGRTIDMNKHPKYCEHCNEIIDYPKENK